MCLIEDDLLLKESFKKFIENHLYLLGRFSLIRLDTWGEGYLTSLNGAKDILDQIYKKGIIGNIDDQIAMCSFTKRIFNTPWTLKIETNKGDCLKTEIISIEHEQSFIDHKPAKLNSP